MDKLSVRNMVITGIMAWVFTLAMRKFVLPAVDSWLPEPVMDIIQQGF